MEMNQGIQRNNTTMKTYIRNEDMGYIKPKWYDGWLEYINSTNRIKYETGYRAYEWELLYKSASQYIKFVNSRSKSNSIINSRAMKNQMAFMALNHMSPIIAKSRIQTDGSGMGIQDKSAPIIKLIHGKSKRKSRTRIYWARGGFLTVQPNGKRRELIYAWEDIQHMKWVDVPSQWGNTKRMVITVD